MTLEELRQAYMDGKIHTPLMIDNDSTSVWPDDDAREGQGGIPAEREFEMHPEELLEQALNLLGIPWEHV
jgi:hypothetical protein